MSVKEGDSVLKYEVAIVGGGVTGLYCAWALRNKNVGLFETSDRCGGRVETVLMGAEGGPKFKAEFGPMRFEAVGQVKLMQLLRDLELATTPFPAYQSLPATWPQYNLTREEDALLELLVDLIHDFEEKHDPLPKSEPHNMVAFLLDQRGMKASDLWPVLGSKSRTSELLSGKREVSKDQAKKLAAFFNMPMGHFI